ncbi:MAG: DNA repair protein RecO [Alphaproteobacteria bacterium]|nr:DNA repair protein RecO [Alphaproteobacteria bacterium]
MEWTDQAVVLACRRHGEADGIISLLTVAHGRHAGLARGAYGRRQQGLWQPGNRVAARWRARLADHLGSLTGELVKDGVALHLDAPLRLAALSAACALVDAALPERAPHPEIYRDLCAFLDRLAAVGLGEGAPDRPAAAQAGELDILGAYVRWELALLADLGFGLDLTQCAATGRNDTLVYVSPKSGRAVSAAAGEPYRAKLLALPAFLLHPGVPPDSRRAARDGLDLAAYFLEREVFAPAGSTLPAARGALADRARQA